MYAIWDKSKKEWALSYKAGYRHPIVYSRLADAKKFFNGDTITSQGYKIVNITLLPIKDENIYLGSSENIAKLIKESVLDFEKFKNKNCMATTFGDVEGFIAAIINSFAHRYCESYNFHKERIRNDKP